MPGGPTGEGSWGNQVSCPPWKGPSFFLVPNPKITPSQKPKPLTQLQALGGAVAAAAAGGILHTASPSHQGSDQSPHHLGLVGGLKDAPRSKVTPLCSLIQFQGGHQDSSPQSPKRGQQEQLVPTGVT